MNTVVELEGVNGEWFTLAGDNAGDKGVYLATGVTGLFDPPVKAMYEDPGNYPGSRYLNHRILRRDLVFAVYILNDKGSGSWLSRDSEWRKAWAFDRDCILRVTTDESGTRYLKVRLFESPDISTETDPNGNSLNVAKMVCVAGDPFWYEDDVVYTATTATDTRFDPNALHLPWPWPKASLPSESLSITVDPSDGRGGLNPTDQYIFPKWTVPGSTEVPAEPYIPGIPWLGAPKSPATIWTLPDYSFEDPDMATRRVRLPGLIGGLRSDEVQVFNLDGRISGGNFKIGLGTETTGNIPYGASTGVVKAALESLAAIAYDDVVVERGEVSNEVQLVEVSGGPTAGVFALAFDGEWTNAMPFNVGPIEMAIKLNDLGTTGGINIQVKAKKTNEIQTVQLVGEPNDGDYTLTFDGETTNTIPWNAGAVVMYSKLCGLSNIGLYDVVVKKDIFTKWSPFEIAFQGQYEGLNLQPMVSDSTNLTGGAGADVIIKQKQPGSRPYEVYFKGDLVGKNLPQMEVSYSGYEGISIPGIGEGLSGGLHPKVTVSTIVEGTHPYIVTFQNNCSGISFPEFVIDTTGLTGGHIASRVWKQVDGYTATAENCVVDSDPRHEQVLSESGSNVWSRMNGVRFRHPIPPWTKSKVFQVDVSGCDAGQMITLRLPRPWSRPWGLE